MGHKFVPQIRGSMKLTDSLQMLNSFISYRLDLIPECTIES